MKKLFRIALILLMPAMVSAQKKSGPGNYYDAIKKFDLSKLWHGERLHIEGGDVPSTEFPEPIGFIGSDYRRFYIHYISIQKDSINPYSYFVIGKTRVGNNICPCTGTITIKKATITNFWYYKKFKQGVIICDIRFKEDSIQKGSGYIKGKLTFGFYLDKKGKIFYDTLDSEADSYSNNEVEGTWTSYTTHKSKKCNWGDFRMPDSGDLDGGAGVVVISEKYVKNGWQSFNDAYIGSKPNQKKAIGEENRKWWQ